MKNEQNKNKSITVNQDLYKKSNFLISAKYKSSLLENKIIAYSLSRSSDFIEDPKSKIIYSRISASEIRELLNGNEGSFYSQLKELAPILTGRVIGITNSVDKTFEFISIISHAKYENSELIIGWNPLLKDFLVNLESNFSLLSLRLVLSFQTNWALRIYELLRAKAFSYYSVSNNEYRIQYSLSELKFELGVADASNEEIRKILDNKKLTPEDFDKALNKANEKGIAKYKTWSDFKRKVIDPAIKEINSIDCSEMNISYKLKKCGLGGKVDGIEFFVKMNKSLPKETIDADKIQEIDDLLDELRDICGSDFKSKDLRHFLSVANGDISKVKKAYEVYKKSKDVDNNVGFMISAIKDGYSSVKTGSKKIGFANLATSPSYTDDAISQLSKTIFAN